MAGFEALRRPGDQLFSRSARFPSRRRAARQLPAVLHALVCDDEVRQQEDGDVRTMRATMRE
jgi:hypothetical protein